MENYIEKAIKLAVKNGWKPQGMEVVDGLKYDERTMTISYSYDDNHGTWFDFRTASCDPDFWQALGKGLGWSSKICLSCGGCNGLHTSDYPHPNKEIEGWRYNWFRFIDHLATKKDPNLFFKEILK